jgi:hypothetical protein
LQTRLDEFSRVYQVLKLSHARLEQQVKGASVSLRTSLLAFREHLSTCQFSEDDPMGGVGDRILQIFRDCGGVQMASLYEVTPPFGVDRAPVARLGRPPSLAASNPLLREAIRTGQTVSLNGDGFAPDSDDLLAVVPLVDVHDQVWGVVAINEMPFVAFQQSTLDLLTIVGGYIGDAIRACYGGGWNREDIAETFRNQLERSLRDARRHQLPAGLVTVYTSSEHLFGSLLKLAKTQSRGLDTVWGLPGDSYNVVSTLLPLTDKDGVKTYVHRLQSLMEDLHDPDLLNEDVVISGLALKAEHNVSRLMQEIQNIANGGAEAVEDAGRFTEWRNARVV